ncbi:MAG TPA: TraR/DksA C4-type zinc finger protein [Acidimicrobiia bacterium]|nr:TraR/DksA C4-type zinc finger protein [Acidimicrobiia bacterium]
MSEPSTAAVRADELRRLREQLLADRAHVTEQLEQLGVGSELSSYDEGFADSGQVTAERGEVEALAGTLLDTRAEIDDALARVEAGTYGVCEGCGTPIPPARLEAMPTARLCIACASNKR